MSTSCCFVEVGEHSESLHARCDCCSCVETSTDGAAAFSAARLLLTETRTENTEISPATTGRQTDVDQSFHSLRSIAIQFFMRPFGQKNV